MREKETRLGTDKGQTKAAANPPLVGAALSAGVYQQQGGKIWRVVQAADGGIKVEILDEGKWVPGPIGMVGLRLSPGTKRLSPEKIRDLPD